MTQLKRLKPVARKGAGPVSVFLDGPVGFPEEGGMSAAMFREQLTLANGAPVDLHINSPGGVVTDGMAMYSALRAYSGRVVGIVDGMAASIASVVLMGCDEIRVAKGAYVMIHNPSGGSQGEAGDLRKAADTLDKMRGELLDIYEARTKIERAKLEKMLDAETYFTAEEAVEIGLADKVESFEAKITLLAVARLNPDKVPAGLRASAKGKQKSMKPKMKAKIEAAEAALAALKASAAADPDKEPEDSEDDEPEDSEDDPEDSEDDDAPEDCAAIVATAKALTGSKSAAVALGSLVALVSKAQGAAKAGRAELVEAAIKSGKLVPSMKKLALSWSEKTWGTYLASMGGIKAITGRKHTPPVAAGDDDEPTFVPPARRGRSDETAEQKIARQMGVSVDSLKKPLPPSARVQGGVVK